MLACYNTKCTKLQENCPQMEFVLHIQRQRKWCLLQVKRDMPQFPCAASYQRISWFSTVLSRLKRSSSFLFNQFNIVLRILKCSPMSVCASANCIYLYKFFIITEIPYLESTLLPKD